ncbi:MAG: hypothetical protein N2376_04320 [Clostridia bacterium]|nr:hypothetical protein [Clostridia bacterium]
MKLELDVYSTICETKRFVINGIQATYRDFGEKQDVSMDRTQPFCCGNMVFLPSLPTQQVLEKYGITKKEYHYICEMLRSCVSFGTCKLCG